MGNSLSTLFCAASVVFFYCFHTLRERPHVQVESCGIHIKRYAKITLRLTNAFVA